MSSLSVRRTHPQLTFLALALVVNIAATLMAHRAHSRAVEMAAACDMTITVTALYYWLVVRPGLRPKISLLFVLSLGLLRASLAFGSLWMGAVAEVGIVTAVACGFRSIPLLTGELSVLYYAIAWWAKADVPARTVPFRVQKREGFSDLILMIGLASLLEVVPVHFVVAQWSAKAAWILTGLSLYGAVWAVGVYRSFTLLPTLVGNGELLLRFGVLFSVRIPLECMASRTRDGIQFTRPLIAEGIFGWKKTVTSVAFHADNPAAFETSIREDSFERPSI